MIFMVTYILSIIDRHKILFSSVPAKLHANIRYFGRIDALIVKKIVLFDRFFNISN